MNQKIGLLTAIYDNTFQRIHNKIINNKKNYNDPMVKEDVLYLATIAEMLINVLRIENDRNKATPQTNAMPPEQKRPDIRPPNSPQNPDFGPSDLGGFPSPGGWQP